MFLLLIKWTLKNTSHWSMKILMISMTPILDLIIYIELIIMVLTWTFSKYPINITSDLRNWKINCPIQPVEDAELMGVRRHFKEGGYPQCLKVFQKEIFNPHTLYDQLLVDVFSGRFGTLHNPVQCSLAGCGGGNHTHGSGVH